MPVPADPNDAKAAVPSEVPAYCRPSNGHSLLAWADLALTALRWLGAVRATRGLDTTALSRLQATPERNSFFIVGPGATLNDLGEDALAQMASGVTASINMALLAPINFDLCALEAIVEERDLVAMQSALRTKSRPPLLWFQDRAKHDNALVQRLEAEFGLYRYRRASVSIRRNIATFGFILSRFMAPRIFDRPNLRVSFALTGSVARLTLLGLSLGYRRIRFAGVDLGSTPYFWLEDRAEPVLPKPMRLTLPEVVSLGAQQQGGTGVVPNLFEFLEALADLHPELDFATLDPKGRSRLTGFLRDLYGRTQET